MMIPVTVLGGYLGAGKTTLLNHLLRNAGGRRLTVLVNDFGEIGIDADLIQSRQGNVLNLAGGCVCCSFGSDLVGALLELPRQDPVPDHVLIETSGVALPGAVARTVGLAGGGLALDAIIVLADAEAVRDRASDRYVGDTVLAQLAEADLIVVSKIDLVDPQGLGDLADWLLTHAPAARLVEADRGEVPAELILGPGAAADLADSATPTEAIGPAARAAAGLVGGGTTLRAAAAARPSSRHAGSLFSSVSLAASRPADVQRIAAMLVEPQLEVIRAKGLFRDLDGRARSLQIVGKRIEIRESAHADPDRGRLVCIGLRDRIDPVRLGERLGLTVLPPAGRDPQTPP